MNHIGKLEEYTPSQLLTKVRLLVAATSKSDVADKIGMPRATLEYYLYGNSTPPKQLLDWLDLEQYVSYVRKTNDQ